MLPDALYASAVGYLESYGIVTGYPDGTFKPDKPVTRAEFTLLLHRLQFMPVYGWFVPGMVFDDIVAETSDHWAVSYLNSAWEKGWLIGDSDGNLRADDPITKAEAMVIIRRALV